MKIVAIVGSPRANGNTSLLIDEALKEAAALGCETEKIVLGQYKVNPCLGHDECASFSTCKQNDDVPWMLEKLREADGIIVGSPVYYYNVTAQMKAFIDRNYFLYTHDIPLKAKCGALVVVGGGAGLDITERALRRYLKPTVGLSDDHLFTLTAYASRVGDIKNRPAALKQARELGRKMGETLKGI